MQKGQKLPPKQRIRLELPEGFLDQFGPFPKSRVYGAAFAAAGAYGLFAMLPNPFATAEELEKELRAQNPDAPDWAIALGVFGDLGFTFLNLFGAGIKKKKPERPSPPSFVPTGIKFSPLGYYAALTVGGMVLAVQNPGEVLKGIGEIIPG